MCNNHLAKIFFTKWQHQIIDLKCAFKIDTQTYTKQTRKKCQTNKYSVRKSGRRQALEFDRFVSHFSLCVYFVCVCV